MKTKKFLSIAALALVGAVMTGCSSDEEIVVVPEVETPQQPADNIVTLTTTIGFDGDDATTRALDYDKDAKKLTKTFAAGDQVAVIYKNTSDQTVKALSTALTTTDISTDGSSATLTVTLTNPKASEAVRFIYPAAMALDPATDAAVDADATVNYAALATQDGTLTALGSTLDLAIYDGTLTSTAELPQKLTLDNKLAICAYLLKNSDGSSDLNSGITSLTVYAGSDTYTVNRTAAAGPIYVAIRPLTTATDILYGAFDGTNTYAKYVTGKTYAANNIYNLGLRMTAGKDLSKLTGDYEAQNGDVLTGTLDGSTQHYKISIADGATVTLMGVTINGVHDGSYNWAGITCLGDATITLAGMNTVKGFYNNYPGIHAALDKTLTINGTGSLTASSNGYGAGIGGGYSIPCGNIKIEGGTIMATGGQGAAGIGGGNDRGCGTINISGGNITATGYDGGAGIGSGSGASCSDITISGGIVNATGGKNGAGIGSGGSSGSSSASYSDITISGGTVTAVGGDEAAGIGTGRGKNSFYPSICGGITIGSGVTSVTATKGTGSPNSIGAGVYGSCGTISIADESKVTQN